MSRAEKSNLFFWLAAAALAIAAVPAADLLHDTEIAVKWVIFAVAMIVAVACFFRAVILAWQDEQNAPVAQRKRKMISLIGMAICGLGFFIFVAIYFWPGSQTNKETEKNPPDLSRNEGVLVPGNFPMPQALNRVPPEALVVMWGCNVSWGVRFPHTILEMAGDPMIVVDKKSGTNNLVVTVLRLFDERNDIIARIDWPDGFFVPAS